MSRTIDNLHDYRVSYSDVAPIPKLTQSSLLGLLLAVQDHEAASPLGGRRVWKPFFAAPRGAHTPIQWNPPRRRLTNKGASQR
jgi:hypothetical protein